MQALGIATADDLRDYYRIPAADTRLPLKQLVEEGSVRSVRVRAWEQQAFLHKDPGLDAALKVRRCYLPLIR